MATVKELSLTGQSLTLEALISASTNSQTKVTISDNAIKKMKENRAFAEHVSQRGDTVYGLSVGVGSRKTRKISRQELIKFNNRMIRDHCTAQGPRLPHDVTKASAIVLLNTLAAGRTNVRPSLALAFARRLSYGPKLADVPMYGGTGIGDIAQLPFLVLDLLSTVSSDNDDNDNDDDAKDLDYHSSAGASVGVGVGGGKTHAEINLEWKTESGKNKMENENENLKDKSLGVGVDIGEALPLIAQSSIATAHAAVAIHQARILLNEMVLIAALDVEGFASDTSPYNTIHGTFRPHAGYQYTLSLLEHYLKGGKLLTEQSRHLQCPLSFRTLAVVLGSAFDALSFCQKQIGIELNSHQQNPLVLMEKDQMIPCPHFDMTALSTALDFMRIALVPCLTAQTERSMKMLQASQTGLSNGLEPVDRLTGEPCSFIGDGLTEFSHPLQGMTIEAKVLSQPVSTEIGSSFLAEGIEDRVTMAGLSARKLDEMVSLGFRCLSISCTIASQAIDLRGKDRLGPALQRAHSQIRKLMPEMQQTDDIPNPQQFDLLRENLQSGFLAQEIPQ